jgi:hypothetical protein
MPFDITPVPTLIATIICVCIYLFLVYRSAQAFIESTSGNSVTVSLVLGVLFVAFILVGGYGIYIIGSSLIEIW